MDKEKLKEEYNHWNKTMENLESIVGRLKSQEELERYNFARGFVSAVDKTGIFKD